MHTRDPERSDRDRLNTILEDEDTNRRQVERRQQESMGCAYISMVGWMDRRRKSRREEDYMDYCDEVRPCQNLNQLLDFIESLVL